MFKIFNRDPSFSMDLVNVAKLLKGEDFLYQGTPPDDFEEQVKSIKDAIGPTVLIKEVDDMFSRVLPYRCRESVEILTNKEEFLDKLVDRINKKQLKENK